MSQHSPDQTRDPVQTQSILYPDGEPDPTQTPADAPQDQPVDDTDLTPADQGDDDPPLEEPDLDGAEPTNDDADDDAGDGDGDGSPDTGADGDPGDDGEVIKTLQELIEAKEWDESWFESLEIPVKVDGREGTATMKDLVANYQMNSAAEQRLDETKEKIRKANEQMSVQQDALTQQLAMAGKLLEYLDTELQAEVQGVDWNELKDNDPGQYSALKLQYQERRDKIEQIKQAAVQELAQAAQKRQEGLNEGRQEIVDRETEALLDAVPDWRDPDKAKAGRAELMTYLVDEMGFTRNDVSAVSDHRLFVMALNSMRWEKAQRAIKDGKSNTRRKRVVPRQKVIEPGGGSGGARQTGNSEPADTSDRAAVLYRS